MATAAVAIERFAKLYPPTATSTMFEPLNDIYTHFVGELIAEGLIDPSSRTSGGVVRPVKLGSEVALKYVHCRTTTAHCPSLIEASTRYAGLSEFDQPSSSSTMTDSEANEEEEELYIQPPPSSEEITWSSSSPISVTATFDHETSTIKIGTRHRTFSPVVAKKRPIDGEAQESFYEQPSLVEPTVHVEPRRAVARLIDVMLSSFCPSIVNAAQ
jgi:hypothetical protein